MKQTPTIKPKIPYFNPKIKVIFENYQNDKYDNANLYQNILEYANDANDKSSSGFKFTELGKWLMERNNEFKNYYSGSKAHTPISARIANKRQRIQNCIDNLKKWDFLVVSKMVPAEKNNTETPFYELTPLGKLIFLIVKAKFSNNDEQNNAIKHIIDIVTSIKEQNDSAIILFITELLNQLWVNNKKSSIIQHFERLLMLELNNGNDFLSSLLGIKYFIYWFIVDEELSFKTLENLTEDKRKIILVNLKTEIEYYYQQNYLVQEDYVLKINSQPFTNSNFNYGDLINSGAIPRAYWENTRFEYINSFSKIVVPSYCDVCNSHRAFVIDVTDYLKSVIRARGPYPNISVSGNCVECRNFLSTHVIRLPFGLVWK